MFIKTKNTTLEFWIQANLIWLLCYPWVGMSGFILVLASAICFFLPKFKYYALISSTIVFVVGGFGFYGFVAGHPTGLPLVTIMSFLIFLALCFFFLRKKRKFPFSKILTFGFVLIASLFFIKDSLLSRILYGIIILWAANFFILVKEADENYIEKSLLNICISVSAPWNFPNFLNLTTNEIRSKSVQNDIEFLQLQKSALRLLIKIMPLALLLDGLHLVMISKQFNSIDWTELLTIRLKPLIFFSVDQNIGIKNDGLRYLFAMVFGGVSYIVGLIYMIVASVACAKSFGFNVGYMDSDKNFFQNFKSLVQSIYYYYSRTLIQVFQVRLINFFKFFNIKPRRTLRRLIYLYFTILIGGIFWNIMNDIERTLYKKSIFDILKVIPLEIPYYILLATMILFSSQKMALQNNPSTSKKFFSSTAAILQLCFVFSLRRLLLLQVGWSEYFRIMREIIKGIFSFL